MNIGSTTLPRALSRRTFISSLAAAGTLMLAGCGATSTRTSIRFNQSKPEVVPYFRDLLSEFNGAQSSISAVHEVTAGLSAAFARNDPPDLGCLNYNYEMARFQERGALSDLSDLPQVQMNAPFVNELLALYPDYPGRTSVLPYSMMGAAVLYNKDIFAKHKLAIPQRYSEFVALCEELVDLKVTPIYSTFKDAWTASQGLADYTLGGAVDINKFFAALRSVGADFTPGSELSFSQAFTDPLLRMQELAKFSNKDAANRGYSDGNLAFANGQAAMYLQGPWALPEISKTNPNANIGTFPLPMTEDPDDLKVRVNIDLALWIPEQSEHQDEARELLEFLCRPEVQNPYNEMALGFGVRSDSPPAKDKRLVQLQPYIDRGKVFQGVSTAIPRTIPFENYMQGLVTGSSVEQTLATLDADWARLAQRG
ncbi:ABC transporter substrate-binding protein [Glutamicibacter sp. 363]|uniref:ABC transporter substrate-binding protein n=1 Tax=unclassified Glutamicibacter TaxID=2627139 RepID=UPI0040333886